MTADEVHRLRARLGLKQTELAAKIGVHPVSVSRWETSMVAIPEPTARLLRLLVQMNRQSQDRKRKGRH